MKVFVYCSLSKKSKKRCFTMLETAKKTEDILYKELDFFLGGGVGLGRWAYWIFLRGLAHDFEAKSFVLICCLINRVRKKD